MKIGLLFLFLLTWSEKSWAQSNLCLRPVFGSQTFVKGKFYTIGRDSFSVSVLKFYLSNIQYFQKGKMLNAEQKKYHLVQLDSGAINLPLQTGNTQDADEIRFCIGVDSMQNADGAGEGDLDPANAMYWTWQSGYIDVKIEGRSSVISSQNHAFEFHLGGFASGVGTLQTCAFHLPAASGFDLVIDLQQFFTGIQPGISHITSPSPKAVEMATHFASCFQLRPK